MGAQVLVEESYFDGVALAIVTNLDSDEEGFATSLNNVLANGSTEQITQEASLSIPYEYT